jgi:hypothetical protein
MHSSRAAFSSLQTQQGLGLFAASTGLPEGLLEAARLLIWRESEAGGWEMVLVWDWDNSVLELGMWIGIGDGSAIGKGRTGCWGGHCEYDVCVAAYMR